MPFQLPDLRKPDVPQAVSYPTGRPALSKGQFESRIRVEENWWRPLTFKQRKFIGALFANGFDAGAAALEADPTIESPKIARRIGAAWLKQVNVKNAIEAVYADYAERAKVRFEDCIDELRAIAFSSLGSLWAKNEDGTPSHFILPHEDDPRMRAIAEISVSPGKYGDSVRVKAHDKNSAMEKLLKLLLPLYGHGRPGDIADDPSKAGDTNVTVHTINIIPVPQGNFIPAPPAPEFDKPLIEHLPINRSAMPSAVAPESIED